MKTAIAQYWVDRGRNRPLYVSLSEQICRAYCDKYNYVYEVSHEDFYPGRHPTWGSVPFVRSIIENYDRVLFLDSDAFFSSPAISLDTALLNIGHACDKNFFDFLVAVDIACESSRFAPDNTNMGVWFVSSTDRGIGVLDAWIKSGNEHQYTHNNHPFDQLCFNELIRGRCPGICVLQEYYLLQGRYGYFIRHLFGLDVKQRNNILSRVAKDIWHL